MKSRPAPNETPLLLKTLLIAFNRAGEDTSLAFKQRLKANYKEETIDMDAVFGEEIFERIDSNVLYAL